MAASDGKSVPGAGAGGLGDLIQRRRPSDQTSLEVAALTGARLVGGDCTDGKKQTLLKAHSVVGCTGKVFGATKN